MIGLPDVSATITGFPKRKASCKSAALPIGQTRPGAARRLPAHCGSFAKTQEERIRLAGGLFGLRCGEILEMGDFPTGKAAAQALPKAHRVRCLPRRMPRPEHLARRIGKRPRHHEPRRLRQRQNAAAILQKDDRLARGLPRERAVARLHFVRQRGFPPEGLVEQAKLGLEIEHPRLTAASISASDTSPRSSASGSPGR